MVTIVCNLSILIEITCWFLSSHNISLCDHCKGSKCFHLITKQCTINPFEVMHCLCWDGPLTLFFLSSRTLMISATSESKAEGFCHAGFLFPMVLSGPVPHISHYPWSWLQQNSYDPVIKQPNPLNKYDWTCSSFVTVLIQKCRKILQYGGQRSSSPSANSDFSHSMS